MYYCLEIGRLNVHTAYPNKTYDNSVIFNDEKETRTIYASPHFRMEMDEVSI